MNVNTEMLTTAEECDAAKESVMAEKTHLERRMRNLGENLEGKSIKSVEITEGIEASKAIISGFQAALEVITDPKVRRDFELKIEREETRLKSLENRQANYNVVSVIEDQIDHQQLEAQLPVLDAAIASIDTRRAELN